jgi:signal transduction histidine kinase
MRAYRSAWPGRDLFRVEYRMRRADGEYRWVLDSAVPRIASDGALLGFIGSCIDITERRLTVAVAEDLRLLSHDLHPDVIRHAGFVDAVRSHCREFAGQYFLTVVVEADPDLAVPDAATALCLDRIVQEALRNIVKHAAGRRVVVAVQRLQDQVQLKVTDDGKGFDLAKTREQGGGLGLCGIDERVRLVGGRLSIDTAPNQGTTISVFVKALVTGTPTLASV